jgi:spore coat polysaccharide biosynthesis protein SpsF (cytidylyltransferase family)
MNLVIITQARFGSSRLPGKVLKKIGNKSLLELHLQRLKKVTVANKIIVATTHEPESEKIIAIAQNENCLFYRGSTEDVLDRFFHASKLFDSSYIVRVTSDCPLIDPVLVSKVIQYTIEHDFTYCMLSEQFPDGVDVEVFKTEELVEAYLNAKLQSEREHVTPYIRSKSKERKFYGQYECREGNFKEIRFTVDEEVDIKAIKMLLKHLGENADWIDYTNFIIAHPDLFPNQSIIRNSGYLKSLKNDTKPKNNQFQ